MQEPNGILLIDKPAGFTSFDVVAKLRGIFHTRKIGHAGTLDPMATGVLPLFFGRAAKAVDLLPRQDKCYDALIQLGITTDTQDLTGAIVCERPVNACAAQVVAAAKNLTGEIQQVPPMYSALKVNGQKLCDLARKGIEIERNARPVTIYSLTCEAVDEQAGLYRLWAHCSKGTYIRTLAHDLGQALGCGAALSALRRTMAAGFSIERCITLAQVQQAADEARLNELLYPVEQAFEALSRVTLDTEQCRMFQNGVRMDPTRISGCAATGKQMTVYRADGLFIGLAEVTEQGFCQRKLFSLEG